MKGFRNLLLMGILLVGSSLGESVKFGVIADPQYHSTNYDTPPIINGSRVDLEDWKTFMKSDGFKEDLYSSRFALKKLSKVLDAIEGSSSSFVITLGDLVEMQYDNDPTLYTSTPNNIETVKAIYKPYIDRGLESHYLVDGHDLYGFRDYMEGLKRDYEKKYVRRKASYSPYYDIVDVIDEWGYVIGEDFSKKSKIDIKELPAAILDLPNPDGYYAFKKMGITFIMLNTAEHVFYEDGWYTINYEGVSRMQLHWFENELKKAQQVGSPTIICGHVPLHEIKQRPDKFSGEVSVDSREIKDMIKKYDCSIAYFAGHAHDFFNTSEVLNGRNFHNVTFDNLSGSRDEKIHPYAIATINDNSIDVTRYYNKSDDTTYNLTYTTPIATGPKPVLTPANTSKGVRSLWVSPTEITTGEFHNILGYLPRLNTKDNKPVVNLTYYEAVKYCNARSANEGFDAAYTINGTTVSLNKKKSGYRLPTKDEWEYLYLGGNARFVATNDNAWTNSNSGYKLKPIAGKTPNGYGLYDMAGNATEWVETIYGDSQHRYISSSNFDKVSINLSEEFDDGRDCSIPSYRRGFRVVRNYVDMTSINMPLLN